MLKINNIHLVFITIISLTCILSSFYSSAQEIRRLIFHSGLQQSRPEAPYLDRFAKLVNEKSAGSLVVDVYHASSLGLKEVDMLRILQAGWVDMALMYGEYYKRDASALASVYVQGAISESQQHLQVLKTLREIYHHAYAKWDIKMLGGVVAPVFNVGLHCKEPINSLTALKNKKVRVWSGHQVDTFNHLGISAQVIPQNDMYLALQTGVVDCAYYLSTVAPTMSLQEVTPFEAYLHPWAASPWMFGISNHTWQSLTKQQQAALKAAGDQIWNETRRLTVDPEREAQAQKARTALGITILPAFNVQDRQAFMAASQKAWQQMAEKSGKAGLSYYQRVSSLTH